MNYYILSLIIGFVVGVIAGIYYKSLRNDMNSDIAIKYLNEQGYSVNIYLQGAKQ